MPDPRFFDDLGPVGLGELARLTGAEIGSDGVDQSVTAVSILEQARPDSVTFYADKRLLLQLAASRAAACFVRPQDAAALPHGCVALVTNTPQAAFAAAARRLHRPKRIEGGQAISPDARIEDSVTLAPGVVVGAGTHIGRGTVVGANSVIGPGVAIGRDCLIGANVSIGFSLIGDRVQILSGAVIGEAGFGAAGGAEGLVDIPQLGRVILQDGVTIGAHSCIDRGAFEDTVIGEHTKIDNLVQIAHNVRVGRNCVMAAHTGLSGSVTVGDGAAFGGRAGVIDHVVIGAGAQIAAASGVMKDIPAGERWGGSPARPVKQWLREIAWVTRNAGRRKEGPEQ